MNHKIKFLLLLVIVLLFCVLPVAGLFTESTSAQSSGYDVIAAVNQLRAANGLPPYEVNSALMAAAQSHSEYMASTGTISHTGSGGTSPSDRAAAAGYGSAGGFSLSENIAAGSGWTAQDAVQIWQGDSLHLDTMLSPNYNEAGAGVATAGNTTYFTLDVGSSSGGSASGSSSSSLPPGVTVFPQVTPVDTATPLADGSIYHVVQIGQALWNVAAIYGVELEEILTLNKLTSNSVIFPGDKLLIKPPPETSTPTPQTTDTPYPTVTRRLTETPPPTIPLNSLTQTAEAAILVTLTPQPSAFSAVLPYGRQALRMVSAVLVIGGLALLVVGTILTRFS